MKVSYDMKTDFLAIRFESEASTYVDDFGNGVDVDSFKTFRAASPPEAHRKGGLRHPIIKSSNHFSSHAGRLHTEQNSY